MMGTRKNEYYKVKKEQDRPDDQETPPEIFEQLNAEYGFTLDAYATEDNALCEKYFTEKDDALTQDWGQEVVFCSPPSKNLKKYIKDAYEKSLKGARVVLLLPSRTDGAAFHEYLNKGYVRFIRGRITFLVDGIRQKAPAPYGSLICEFGPNVRPRKHIVDVARLTMPVDLQPVLIDVIVDSACVYKDVKHVMKSRGAELPITEEGLMKHLISESDSIIGRYLAVTYDRLGEVLESLDTSTINIVPKYQ